VEDGIAALRRSTELNPEFVVPRLNLAFALLRAGQVKEAELHLEAVLAMEPTEHAASAKLEELRADRKREMRRGAPRGSLTS
jgi:Tfp pilus assembly protein PilF